MTNRSDFKEPVKKALAKRAGNSCSFPGCDAVTEGPSSESDMSVSKTGMACHIYAAATGPSARRVNLEISDEKLTGISNGIWMCYTHGKLIDTDESTYTVEQLTTWKEVAELRARLWQQLGRRIDLSPEQLANIISPNKVYYIDFDVLMSNYNADDGSYWLIIPKTLGHAPTAFKENARELFKYIDPKLSRFDRDNDRGQFFYVPLVTHKDNNIYIGQNAYGAKSPVVSTDKIQWGLAVIFNKFINMVGYGYKLEFYESDNYKYDKLRLIISAIDAKQLKISNNESIKGRLGVRFSYGVGDRAKAFDMDMHSPTISEPWESKTSTFMMAVDLDSLCLINKTNNEVMSCSLLIDALSSNE